MLTNEALFLIANFGKKKKKKFLLEYLLQLSRILANSSIRQSKLIPELYCKLPE